MPNGGSDCCGTCCFNSKNGGETGYSHAGDPGEDRCTLRDVVVGNPFWTYCANHPAHNSGLIKTPVGPIYVGDESGRNISVESPDNEEIRQILLQLLDAIAEVPQSEYPMSASFNETVIQQLGEFREKRAVGGLRRVIRFDPFAKTTKPPAVSEHEVLIGPPYSKDNQMLVAHALEALASISQDAALPDLQKYLSRKVSWTTSVLNQLFARPSKDPAWGLRAVAVRALRHCSSKKARELLLRATRDPQPKIAALARSILTDTNAARQRLP